MMLELKQNLRQVGKNIFNKIASKAIWALSNNYYFSLDNHKNILG